MKIILSIAALTILLTGCARFSSYQTDRSFDENGKITRETVTKPKATTVFTSKSHLQNFEAKATDKTLDIKVGSLVQESSSTNFIKALELFVEGIKALSATAVK